MNPEPASWNLAKRISLRFLAVYLLLYPLPFPLRDFPILGTISDAIKSLWHQVVPWFGRIAFDLEITTQPSSSGDTTYNYIQLLLMMLVSVLGAVVWALADRKRRHDPFLAHWLPVGYRYYLVLVMLDYGLLKIFKLQFTAPGLDRLVQTYGDSSPMALADTFMGFSTPYSVFTGGLEVLAGLLLLFRRTTTLGALVSCGIMANVWMMNFCFDLPAKLFASHVLLMAAGLVALDGRRLLNLLIWNRPTAGRELAAHFRPGRPRTLALVAKFLLIAAFLSVTIHRDLGNRKYWSDDRPRPSLYGVYLVDRFEQDGEILPPLTTRSERWRRMIVEDHGRAEVQFMDGTTATYGFRQVGRTLILSTFEDNDRSSSQWTFERASPDRLVMNGEWLGSTLRIEMTRKGPEDYLLVNRGFNWIQEQPFDP